MAGASEGYKYDEALVELLQKKIAAQEEEMAKLRDEVDKANLAKGIVVAGDAPVSPIPKAKKADASTLRRVNPALVGLQDPELEAKYGVEYALKHGIGIGAGSLGLTGPPDDDTPKEHNMRLGILNSRSVLLSDSN